MLRLLCLLRSSFVALASDEARLRLPVHPRADRRLWRRQVMPAPALCGRQVDGQLHLDNWRGLQDPDDRARWKNHQAADLGHGGPGALPHDQQHLLPRRARHHRRVRCDQPRVVRQRRPVAHRDRQVRARERQQAAGGQQGRHCRGPRQQPSGPGGRGQELRRV